MKVAVVGGSLGGLAAANVFHRLGAAVVVFERSQTTLEAHGACLGFVDRRLWESLRGAPLVMDGQVVPDQSADGEQSFENSGSFYYGDMWHFLYSGLPDGTVRFGRTIESLGDDAERPCIDGEVFDLALIADGGWSMLRDKYFTVQQPEYTGYQIYWGRVAAEELPGLSGFDGRTEANGIYNCVNLPVPKFDGSRMYMCGFFVATPEDEIRKPERAAADNRQVSQTTGSAPGTWFLPFVRES